MMTKKDLVWRLKELPTAEGIASLVEMEVITKEEGRQLLLTETQVDEGAKIQALEEEVKFLRKLVDTLASKTNNYPVIWNTYKEYTPHYERWYKRYEPILCEYKSTPAFINANTRVYDAGTRTMMSAGSSSTGTLTASNSVVSSNTTSVKKLSDLN